MWDTTIGLLAIVLFSRYQDSAYDRKCKFEDACTRGKVELAKTYFEYGDIQSYIMSDPMHRSNAYENIYWGFIIEVNSQKKPYAPYVELLNYFFSVGLFPPIAPYLTSCVFYRFVDHDDIPPIAQKMMFDKSFYMLPHSMAVELCARLKKRYDAMAQQKNGSLDQFLKHFHKVMVCCHYGQAMLHARPCADVAIICHDQHK